MLASKRVELELSPRRQLRCVSRTSVSPVHTGLAFADGKTVHTGGRLRVGVPRDHQVIAPARPAPNELVIEPHTETANGKYLALGRLKSPSRTAAPPTPEPTTPRSGKKRIECPSNMPNLMLTGVDYGTEAYRRQRMATHAPSDNFITGLTQHGAIRPDLGTHPRGVKTMHGPPEFVPQPFQKRPYSPQLRRVGTKPPDNDIFLNGGLPSSRCTTPVRTPRPL